MKLKKLIIPLFAVIGIFAATLTMSNNRNHVVYAEEPVSSEVISSEVTSENNNTTNKVLNWYEENEEVINLITEAVTSVVFAALGVLVVIKKLKDKVDVLVSNNTTHTENSSKIEGSVSRMESLVERQNKIIAKKDAAIEEQNKRIEEQNNKIVSMESDISAIKQALAIAYCNDLKMAEDGRAEAIEGVLNNESSKE